MYIICTFTSVKNLKSRPVRLDCNKHQIRLNKEEMQTIHDCLQASLQNEYFKEKLTDFYKENKRLKEEVAELKRLRTLGVRRDESEVSTQTQCEPDSNVNQRLRGSTTCSVCIDRVKGTNGKVILKSTSSSSLQENHKPKTTTETTKTTGATGKSNDFDNDVFNKQNKVSTN